MTRGTSILACRIHDTSGDAIQVYPGGRPLIEGGEIWGCAGVAIRVDGPDSAPAISKLCIHNMPSYGVKFTHQSVI